MTANKRAPGAETATQQQAQAATPDAGAQPDTQAGTETGHARPVPDGCIRVGDDVYMRDAKGCLTPKHLVRDQDGLQDQMVRDLVGHAEELSARIARFRVHCFDDVGTFDATLAEKYGGHARASVKGNRTYLSYDGCLKVQVQIAERVAFGPELQVARDLVEECLAEWAEDSRPEIRSIITHAFNVDKEGEISRAAIYTLLRHQIEDDRWQSAMLAIRDAMRVIGSKTYIRCYRRPAPDAAWQAITIDLARAG